MSDALITAVIAGVVGLMTGVIGSLFAPWAQWGIEKRRKRIDRRTTLVDGWRELLTASAFERNIVLNDPSYGVLRALLSEEARTSIERPANHLIVVMGEAINSPDRRTLMYEVARIEHEWGLL